MQFQSTPNRFEALAAVAAGAIVLLTAVGANAARPQTIEAMVQGSHLVVRARVLTQEARWNDSHTTIHTFTQVEAIDVLAKAPALRGVPATIVVQQNGGRVGNLFLPDRGHARFHQQEEVILFLRAATDNTFTLLNGTRGKLRIVQDLKTAFAFETKQAQATTSFARRPLPLRTAPRHAVALSELERRVTASVSLWQGNQYAELETP